MNISEVFNSAPSSAPPVVAATFALLDQLSIPYTRVEHDHADTMEDCVALDAALGVTICKNLLLCNRQKTAFYLLTLSPEKPFVTKELSQQIGSARLSFASGEDMTELLGVAPGSASILALMNDRENRVQLLMDRATHDSKTFGCHPCLNTGSVKLKTADILNVFLPHIGHVPTVVDL